MVCRFRLALPIVLAPVVAVGAELEAETVAAYERYIAQIERVATEAQGRSWIEDASPPTLARLRAGEIIVSPGSGDGIFDVPDGLIHHWRGAAFIPDVALDAVLAVTQDYSRYAVVYDWVIGSGQLAHERVADGERDRYSVFLRIKRSAGVVTSVVDLWTFVEYRYQGAGRVTVTSDADCIRQVENAGEPDEQRLPPGAGSGYLWRANTYSTYLQRDGGVYVEFETVGLSRDFPPLLGWLIEPIARRLGRGSAGDSLRQLRQAVLVLDQPRAAVDPAPAPIPTFWCTG